MNRVATNAADSLLSAAEDHLVLRDRLEVERLRAELWKAVALAMRAHTNGVGVRMLRVAIMDEEDLL